MACGRNMLNLAIIVILIFIIFAMLYRGNVYKETFHAPYNSIVENGADINTNNPVIHKSSIYDFIRNFFSKLLKVD
jgi:hypothetical protein